MTEITLENLTKRFGSTTAVEELSLSVADGEAVGLVGPSGCGKTTTLRMVAGFETPSGGRVLFDDEDVTHVPPEKRDVGIVFQSYALFENMTVVENVAFGPKVRGVGRAERRERAAELLELLDIDELADRDPTTLSGGQQQRVGLARALAIEPRVLLLDEPMTGLDARLKRRLRTDVGRLLEELDVTTVYVTHDQEEAMTMCDRIAVMNDGVLEQAGDPRSVYETPANPFVADFIGTSNLLDGTVEAGRFRLAGGSTNGDDVVTVVARPGDFTLGEGTLSGTVTDAHYLGETVRTIVELQGGPEVTLALDRERARTPGEQVTLGVDPETVHVLDGR